MVIVILKNTRILLKIKPSLQSLLTSGKFFNSLLLLLISYTADAQQATKIDCCYEIEKKATIIINNNTTTVNSSANNTNTANNSFNFELSASVKTSAGVYDASGNLIRTLWSGVHYDAGCYSGYWDGLLDDGTGAPSGNYNIKIRSNNVQYTWEGVVGNTSKYKTGAYIHKGYHPMQCAAIAGGKLFYGNGYSEYLSTQHYVSLDSIQVRLDPEANVTTQSTYFACTDGKTVFFAGEDANSSGDARPWFVIGKDLNLKDVSFSSGASYSVGYGITYSSVIDLVKGANYISYISGMDVQKNGNFLIVSRATGNNVHVINKTTGALVQTISMNSPTSVACDNSNGVWISTGQVNPYTETPFTSGAYADANNAYDATKAFDNNVSSAFASDENHTPTIIGIDAGTVQTSSVVKIAPRATFGSRLVGAIIQGSNDNSSWTDLATITAAPADNVLTSYPIPTSSFRYWRLYRNSKDLDVAEVQFYPPLNSRIEKFTINSDGTLTSTGIHNQSMAQPGAMAISPTTGQLAVIDIETNQVRFLNPNDASQISVFGRAGGYKNSPAVTNDKFYFINKPVSVNQSYIAFQPDGSYWLGDWGTYRMLHLSASNTYLEKIAYVPHSRKTAVDMNDPTRIFANYIEYKRDYSKPLGGDNGSWDIVNNWFYGRIPDSDITGDYQGFYQVVTLSNGRTYTGGNELTTTGLRATTTGDRMNANGDRYSASDVNAYIQLRTGFDASGNPTYGSKTIIAVAPKVSLTPAYGGAALQMHNINPTKWLFSNLKSDQGFHTGLVQIGTNNAWQSLFTPSTSYDYRGEYPTDGAIDIGNCKNPDNAESHYLDNSIFWNDHGEFYKSCDGNALQINRWSHYWDDGLLISSFGDVNITNNSPVVTGTNAAWRGGNVYSNGLTKYNGDYYGYYCDESVHSGIGAFKVSNLASVSEQKIPLVVSKAIAAIPDPTNLMVAVPYRSDSFTGNSDWTFSPVPTGVITSTNKWNVRTNILSYRKDLPDVYMESYTNTLCTGKRSLGTNNTNNWSLTGKIAWKGFRSYGNTNNTNFQILDDTGKAITNFTVNYNPSNYYGSAVFNSISMFSLENNPSIDLTKPLQSFSITNTNGTITCSYAGYSTKITQPFATGANVKKPASIIVNLKDKQAIIALSELHFKAN